MKSKKTSKSSQIAWYPSEPQKLKIEKLKKKLFITTNSDLIHRAIAELYSRNITDEPWN